MNNMDPKHSGLFEKCRALVSRSKNADFVQEGIGLVELRDIILPALEKDAWQILDLSENSLGIEGAILLSNVLSTTRLVELSLSYNNIQDAGVSVLAQALPHCSIERLDLEGNGLTDESIIKIAQVLPISRVTELYCSYNKVTDQGVLELSSRMQNLRVLDLFSNRVGDAGVIAMATNMSSVMSELYLGENPGISDGSVLILARAIEKSNIRNLGLMKNKVTDAGTKALIKAAKRSNLVEILLDGNPVSASSSAELDRILLLKDSPWFKLTITLCSVRDVERLGMLSFLRCLPRELIRKLVMLLRDDEAL